MREITIRQRLNGYEVTVGCQTIVLEGGPDKLAAQLFAYASNPAQVEREWLAKFGGKMDEMAPPNQADMPQAVNIATAARTPGRW